MERVIVVISGPIKAGKTTLADGLVRVLEGRGGGRSIRRIRTRDILAEEYLFHPKSELRERLQYEGERLDRETHGAWVARATASRAGYRRENAIVIIDAVRRNEQIEALSTLLESPVFHVYVTAGVRKRRRRYETRVAQEGIQFEVAAANLTERDVSTLKPRANMSVDSGRWPPVIVRSRVRFRFTLWRLRRRIRVSPTHVALVGLGAVLLALMTLLPVLILDAVGSSWSTTVGVLLVVGVLFACMALVFIAPNGGSRRSR
jgi:hypothetical protein